MDRGPQPTLNTEKPWLNVFITHSKFISSPFTSLFLTIFQYFLNLSLSYTATNTGKSAIEMNTCSCLSIISPSMLFLNQQVNMSGSLLFTRFIYARGVYKRGGQSGLKHLTGDSLRR